MENFTRKIRFIGYNENASPRLPMFSEDGIHIDVMVEDGHLCVVLKVDEYTTDTALRKAIPLALQWRNRLLEFQDRWFSGGKFSFIMRLCTEQRNGQSYAEIASSINEALAKIILEATEFKKAFEAAAPTFRTWGDHDSWVREYRASNQSENPKGFEHAMDILVDLGFSKKDAWQIIEEAAKNVSHGKPPFEAVLQKARQRKPLIDYPVDRERIIAVLTTCGRDNERRATCEKYFNTICPRRKKAEKRSS